MPFPCLKPRRSSKVFPAPNANLDVDLVEIRKGRVLRIQHINPRMRNKQLPQAKQIKNSSLPPVELRVPRVNFYGNKCIVADPNANQNNVRNGFNKISASANPPGAQHKRHISYDGKARSNVLFSGLSKDQKRMLFKMGIRSASALKNIVLFFFHGVGGSSDIWQTQISYFSSLGFEIVAPDLIGHGMSEIPLKKRAYHFREILADVLAIFDRYCKKKNLIIGHSYGCAFTTVLARERARRVWRLVMISGGGPIPLAPEIGIFALPLWIVSCIRPCLDQVFEKSAFKTKQRDEMLKRASFSIPSFVLHYVINGQDWPEGDEVYHSWISVPTLLINGRDDTFATLEDAKLMKATIHGSKLEIVDEASHMVMLEAPDKVNKLILEFICSRGPHKLPDVKELAEEGIETPQRSAVSEKQFETSQEGEEQTPSPGVYTHKWASVHTEAPLGCAEEEQGEREHDEEEGEEEVEEQDRDNEDKDEVIITIPSKTSPSQRKENAARYRCRLKKGVVTGYDNASYEYEESEGGYYIYKDQYGQSHYVSAEKFHELFDKSNKQLNSLSETRGVNDIEVNNMNIPSFEDIDIYENCKESYVKEYQLNNQEVSSTCKDKVNDINILPHKLSQNTLKSSDGRWEETHTLYLKSLSSFDRQCKNGVNRQEAEINSKHSHGNRPANTQPFVTLALGRQRSDSLDYLGEEELIIVTAVKEKENNCMYLKDSSHDTAPMKNTSQNSILNKRSDYSSPNNSKSNVLSNFSVNAQALHSELVQKLNTKLNPQEKKDVQEPNVGIKETHSIGLNEESVVNRGASFLESRKLMEEHFSKSALRMSMGARPIIPLPGAPIYPYKSSQVSPGRHETTKSTNPENIKDSRDNNGRKSSLCCAESSIVTSSPSFLQSKKAINEHFSKIGLRNPQFSSTTLSESKNSCTSYVSNIPLTINSRKESKNIRLSPNKIQPKQENTNTDTPNSPSKSGLSLNEWAERHLQTISEIVLPSGMNSKESSPKISPEAPSLTSDKESETEKQMSLKGWAEKHLKLISEFITPPVTPINTNSRNNNENSNDVNDSEKTENRLQLSQWAERHVKLISEGKSGITSRNIPVDTLDNVNRVQSENDTNKQLNLSEWAERHARRVSSMASNLPVASEPDVERKRIEESKQEQECIQNKLSVSEWAKRHARKISSMTSNVTTNSKPESPQNNDETEKTQERTSTVRIAASNLSIKTWAEKHVNIISEGNSSPTSGSRRSSLQRVSLPGENTFDSSKASEDYSKLEHKNWSLVPDTQTPFTDKRILNKNLQISSPNDANLPNHEGSVSDEDKPELQICEENQINNRNVGDLPEETEDCENNSSKTTDKHAMDKVDAKFKDVIDETDKNELVIQDKQASITDDGHKKTVSANGSELNPDVDNKKEGIGFMEAKSSRQKLQDAISDCSEICEVDEIPHLSNTDLNRWAERHFEKILGAHTQSDSQKQISSQMQQDIFEGDKRPNRNKHLDKKADEHRRSEIITESKQAETIQYIDNKSMTNKSDSKGPEPESDSSSDICFESCYEHFPESPTNSQTNDLCSQSFVIDTDDMLSAGDNSLTSDILAPRFSFDDNSNVVDSDTDMYSDQFNLEEINVKSQEIDSSMKHESNPILKHGSFTNPELSNSTTSVLRSTCKQLNPSENTLASDILQSLDSENTQSQQEIETTELLTQQTVSRLNKNYSSSTLLPTHIASNSLADLDNANITQRKRKPSFDSSFNNSVSPKCQAIPFTNIEDKTDLIQCQALSLREENVHETDIDNNLNNNFEDKVKFDDVKVTTANTASTTAVELSIKPISTNDSLPRLKSFQMNVL